MTEQHFHLQADWPGGRNSEGFMQAGNLQTKISIPTEMGGPGIGTNPDEMLLGAAATCYVITLAAMIERAELPLKEMGLESEGIVEVTRGVFTYKKIIHRPRVTLTSQANQEAFDQLASLIEKAEESCMISRALRGNVVIQVEPTIK